MFSLFASRDDVPQLTVDELDKLLNPFFYLDEELVAAGKYGEACALKFNNAGRGVPQPIRMKLNAIATAIQNDKYLIAPELMLKYIDLFTLYSNQLDQQRFDVPPEIAVVKEKEALVLNFLKAAFKLAPSYFKTAFPLSTKTDYSDLAEFNTRELSSYDQMLHYYGKALRYDTVPVPTEQRLDLLLNSLRIARYLSITQLAKEADPHAYQGRIATRELPVNYCLQDLKRYDEAIELILPQLDSPIAFHRAQAHVQLSKIYKDKYLYELELANGDPVNVLAVELKNDIAKAIKHGHGAFEESLIAGNTLLPFNARVCLMEAFQVANDHEKADEIAHEIITLMDTPNSGAKPLHREAAERILAANQVTSVLAI